MAWRNLELKDIAATLSQRELDDFRKHPDFESGRDPVADLLGRTVALVRGYIRKNAQVRMSPDLLTIPESLISPACDYVAFDILKRLPGAMHEWRRTAREQAIALFQAVARDEITPESYNETSDDTADEKTSIYPCFKQRASEMTNVMPWRV